MAASRIGFALFTDLPVPSAGYGSWSQRIEYLLQHFSGNVFDYIVVPEGGGGNYQQGRTERIACAVGDNRLMKRMVPHYRFSQYKKALARMASRHDFLVLGIIDSLRLKNAVWAYVQQLGIAHKCKLLYYQCGYGTYLTPSDWHRFIAGIDQYIYLTESAYRFELEHNPLLPFTAHVLHNPIDHNRYHVPTSEVRVGLRQQLGLAETGIHFLWASHDRPKKGLDVVLQAWQRWYPTAQVPVYLHVVGVSRQHTIPGVQFHGRVMAADMHRYMQAADIGVFSSLWTEGFSLALAEQISCGLLTIASTAGCVAEFFKAGEHGIAIDTPNFPSSWEHAFGQALQQLPKHRLQLASRNQPPFLTYDAWCSRFCQIFTDMGSYYFGA